VGVRKHVRAPDGHAWTVQLVWWPRPGQFGIATDVSTAGRGERTMPYASGPYGGYGGLFGLLFDAVHLLLWPLVLVLRAVRALPWLVEAFRDDALGSEGFAWHVRGLDGARSVVDALATAITAGNRRPELVGAKEISYRRHPPTPSPGARL
jgi:hypothetical protein